MSRTVITAQMVESAAPNGRLDVPQGALLTPLARDVARDLGVSLVLPGAGELAAAPAGVSAAASSAGTDEFSDRVRSIVAALLATGGAGEAAGSTPSNHSATTRQPVVKLCRQQDAVLEDFPYPGPPAGMSVQTGDVVTADDGAPMAAGYMTLTKGTFEWVFSYDEVQVVLEGELHIGTPQGVRVAKAGDIMFVPKGSQITFGTPSWTRFVYVTFPADWEAGL